MFSSLSRCPSRRCSRKGVSSREPLGSHSWCWHQPPVLVARCPPSLSGAKPMPESLRRWGGEGPQVGASRCILQTWRCGGQGGNSETLGRPRAPGLRSRPDTSASCAAVATSPCTLPQGTCPPPPVLTEMDPFTPSSASHLGRSPSRDGTVPRAQPRRGVLSGPLRGPVRGSGAAAPSRGSEQSARRRVRG